MTRKIVSDLDGCCCDFDSLIINKLFEDKVLSVDDYYDIANRFNMMIPQGIKDIDLNEYIINVVKENIENVKPFPDTPLFLNKLCKLLNNQPQIIFITARDNDTKKQTEKWIKENLFHDSDVDFTLYMSSTKDDLLKDIRPEILIEDDIDVVRRSLNYVNRIYLVNRSWNVSKSISDSQINNVERVDNIMEIFFNEVVVNMDELGVKYKNK